MLTLEQAAALKPNTEEMENAMEALAEICERERGNKEAAKILMLLLNKNEAYVMGARFGF